MVKFGKLYCRTKAKRAGSLRNATTLKAQQSISKRVDEILSEREKMASEATRMATEALGIDRAWVLGQLKENVQRAMQAIPLGKTNDRGEPVGGEWGYEGSVANRALELLGKEIGMFIDRSKSEATVSTKMTIVGGLPPMPMGGPDNFGLSLDKGETE